MLPIVLHVHPRPKADSSTHVLWMFCIPHKPFKLKKPLNALTWLKTAEMMGKSKHVLSRS